MQQPWTTENLEAHVRDTLDFQARIRREEEEREAGNPPIVHWLDVTDEHIRADILSRAIKVETSIANVNDAKRAAVERLTDEPVPEGLSPLQAWLKWLHEVNGYEYTEPAHRDIADAIAWTPGASRFLFWLA